MLSTFLLLSPKVRIGVENISQRGKVVGSQLDLCAQLNNTVSWNFEQRHGAGGVARHGNKNFLAPPCHIRKRGGNECFSTEKEGSLKHIEFGF